MMLLSSFHFICLLAQFLCHATSTTALLNPSSYKKNGLSSNNRSKSFVRRQRSSNIIHKIRGGSSPLLSMSSGDAIRLAKTLAPKFGILTSTALYFAPTAAVLSAIKNDSLGDLNPFPLAIMSIVSVSWLAYGLTANDIYVALSNIAGCIGSIGFVVGILPLLGKERKKSLLRTTQGVLLGGTSIVLCLWTYLGLSSLSVVRMSEILGMFASTLFIILSGSPLSTISTVLKTKDSSSILGAFTAAQVTNTVLWSIYGLAVKDRFVWGPNLIGLVLGLMQLALKLMFPSAKKIEEPVV